MKWKQLYGFDLVALFLHGLKAEFFLICFRFQHVTEIRLVSPKVLNSYVG